MAASIPSAAFTQFPLPINFPGANSTLRPDFFYRNGQSGVPFSWQWDGTKAYLGFTESGVYMIYIQHILVGNVNDFGTTGSGWTGVAHHAITGSQGSVLDWHFTMSNSTTANVVSSNGPAVSAVIDCEDPELDFTEFSWNLGTGGSATATSANNVEIRVVALPPGAVALIRKELRLRKGEEKTVDDMKPKMEEMFKEWMAKIEAEKLKPQRAEDEKKATLSLTSSALLQTLEERLEAAKTARDPEVTTTTTTERWFVPRQSSRKA